MRQYDRYFKNEKPIMFINNAAIHKAKEFSKGP